MTIDRSYIDGNTSLLRRLRTLMGRFRDDDFDNDAGGAPDRAHRSDWAGAEV